MLSDSFSGGSSDMVHISYWGSSWYSMRTPNQDSVSYVLAISKAIGRRRIRAAFRDRKYRSCAVVPGARFCVRVTVIPLAETASCTGLNRMLPG